MQRYNIIETYLKVKLFDKNNRRDQNYDNL